MLRVVTVVHRSAIRFFTTPYKLPKDFPFQNNFLHLSNAIVQADQRNRASPDCSAYIRSSVSSLRRFGSFGDENLVARIDNHDLFYGVICGEKVVLE